MKDSLIILVFLFGSVASVFSQNIPAFIIEFEFKSSELNEVGKKKVEELQSSLEPHVDSFKVIRLTDHSCPEELEFENCIFYKRCMSIVEYLTVVDTELAFKVVIVPGEAVGTLDCNQFNGVSVSLW